jgi:hypothetical protein
MPVMDKGAVHFKNNNLLWGCSRIYGEKLWCPNNVILDILNKCSGYPGIHFKIFIILSVHFKFCKNMSEVHTVTPDHCNNVMRDGYKTCALT